MKTNSFMLLLAALLAFSACNDDDDIIIPGSKVITNTETTENTNKNTTGPAEAQNRYEFPKLKGGQSIVVVHRAVLNNSFTNTDVNYCVEWDAELQSQRWSCYQLYSDINFNQKFNVVRYNAENDGSLSPESQYPNDPDLPSQYQFTLDPYKYSGYDHGHICPSADRQRSSACNYQTFFITNMQPQYNKFNAGLWEKMEEDVRTWADQADTIYVCKGGTIDSSANVLEYVNQSSHQSTRVNASHIPVPRYFFMAILSKKGNQLQAMGYWAENLNADHSKDSRRNYAYTIDELERKTGIDFFCNLPDDIENQVESSFNAAYWGF